MPVAKPVVVTVLVALCALVAWVGVASDRSTEARQRSLARQGVAAQGSVVSSTYDESAGVSGWTTLRVAFTTGSGQRITQSIGHDSRGVEQPGATVAIRYDHTNPHSVELVDYPPGSKSFDILVGFVIAVFLSLGVLATFAIPRKAWGAERRTDAGPRTKLPIWVPPAGDASVVMKVRMESRRVARYFLPASPGWS